MEKALQVGMGAVLLAGLWAVCLFLLGLAAAASWWILEAGWNLIP